MAKRKLFLVVVSIMISSLGSGWALAQEGEDLELRARQMEIDARSKQTLDNLLVEKEGAGSLYAQAAGYAVFRVTKAGGFLVTGAGGSGVAVNKATGDRVYMRMGSGGVGLGLGAQQYDLVIMFEDQAQFERFMDGGWDSSATAQAAAGQEGINLTSSFIDGIAVFQITDKGLMAIADVSGTRFWVADALN
ncbi:MAG TPA: YSC84-related protein [Gammaproteobacteria bacterium]